MPSARMFNADVTVRRLARSAPDRAVVAAADLALRASVQPMSARRQALHGAEAGVTLWTVYLPVDPGAVTGDQVLWGDRTLSALAPARDEAGRGVLWALDCSEVR